MANNLINADIITGESLAYFHTEARLIKSIPREYDDQFKRSGGKIGDSLRIRMPNQSTVSDGPDITGKIQSTTESAKNLTIARWKSVALDFSAKDLTLHVDQFRKRYIDPAMKGLVAAVEADVASMALDVANYVGTPGTKPATAADGLALLANARKKINDNSFISNDNRKMLITTDLSVALTTSFPGLVNPSGQIGRAFEKGYLSTIAGFDVAEHGLLPTQTCGTRTNTTPLINGSSEGSTISIDGMNAATATVKKGDRFTIAGVYEVHPESKVASAVLKHFVCTADTTASGSAIAALPISPAIIASGAYQNVSAAPADNAALTFAGTASTNYALSLAYDPDAFAFVTADIELPNNQDMASRAVVDGVSLSFVRFWDGNKHQFVSRIDVLYGFLCKRPELACIVYA